MVGWHLRQPNLLFALKTGIGATLLSSLAFLPQTRQIWLEYRGEWSLISYMVIMSQTVGSTNNLALKRIFGTFGGATIAVVAYIAFDGNAIALPIFGALFSVPCFYVIIIRVSDFFVGVSNPRLIFRRVPSSSSSSFSRLMLLQEDFFSSLSILLVSTHSI